MKVKNVFILFFLALPIMIFGRFIQLFTMIDPSTGFFLDSYHQMNFFMSVFLTGILLIIMLLSFTNKDYPNHLFKKSKSLGLLSVLFSLFFLIYSAKMITDGSIFNLADASGYTTFSIGSFIYFFLTFLCAISFCLFGISQNTTYDKGRFSLAFPIIFWIYRLIYIFVGFTGIANISENVIELLAVSLSLLFFLAHGKLINEIDYKKNIKYATSFGIAAAILCGISTVPRYILFLIGRTDLIHENAYGSPIDFILMFYIICFLFVYLKKGKSEIH